MLQCGQIIKGVKVPLQSYVIICKLFILVVGKGSTLSGLGFGARTQSRSYQAYFCLLKMFSDSITIQNLSKVREDGVVLWIDKRFSWHWSVTL